MVELRTPGGQSSLTRPSWPSRLLAAAAYLGAGALLIVISPLQRPFVLRHARVALALHLARAAVVTALLLGLAAARAGFELTLALRLAIAVAFTLLAGVPWAPGLDRSLILVPSLVSVGIWLLSLAGLAIALAGRTADVRAFLNADWPEHPLRAAPQRPDEPVLREEARALWEHRLARMWEAARVAMAERQRRARMTELEEQIHAVHARLAHLRHLLGLGELSLGQFSQAEQSLLRYLSELERELAAWTQRLPIAQPAPPPPAVMTTLPRAELVMLTVIDPAGTPVFSWGHFPLDEALTAGMMSALDSLAEEMFGAPVQKTALAEGAVVSVVRGERTRLVAWFDGDPSPVQLRDLQSYLEEFERANAAALASLPVDPGRIVAPPVPLVPSERA
ncbi:hypothetical protein NET02_03285 [Thermomicrobiaceae bacterium CFH 74404]|uniref:Uncharacterized protein n=1 Tax=Thermalbibacter longus TaxID=2951981 RepID=A0AA42BBU9_9BACT|nr:hypothetical protein [Thermalbibacter longus]MCM8748158.1 hypothetical protein [Thermalbibacter longus]